MRLSFLSTLKSLNVRTNPLIGYEMNWTLSGFQKNGAIVQSAPLPDPVVLAVAVGS